MANKRKVAPAEPRESGPSAEPAEGSTTLDVDALRQIVEILEASDVSRLVWRKGTERLVIRRDRGLEPVSTVVHSSGAAVSVHSKAAPAPSPPQAAPKPADKPGMVVSSPFVGTFYRSPSPDQASFVEVGSVVRKGQVLCIVEAMKLMNEIESEVAGKVAEILVPNGQAVEFGQPLFRIEPA